VNAPPDGYTLLLACLPNASNATLYDKLNFNFIRDIAPVAGIALSAVTISTKRWSSRSMSAVSPATRRRESRCSIAPAAGRGRGHGLQAFPPESAWAPSERPAAHRAVAHRAPGKRHNGPATSEQAKRRSRSGCRASSANPPRAGLASRRPNSSNSFEYNDPAEIERAEDLLVRWPIAGKNHTDH
jgi:hypothetical protein